MFWHKQTLFKRRYLKVEGEIKKGNKHIACCVSLIYLYIGDERPSLYQMTRYTTSSAIGGVILHDSMATPPATASASLTLTATNDIVQVNHG